MLTHSEQCVEETQAFDRKLKAWDAKWPNACKACGAAGAWHHPGGREEPPDGGPCSECTENGLCARCLQPGLTDDGEGPCKHCGWNYDDVRPSCDGPCECELEAMEKADEELRRDAALGNLGPTAHWKEDEAKPSEIGPMAHWSEDE